jgi:hypothetical protein
MRTMLARAVLFVGLVASCSAWATHVPGVGGRQLDRFSPVVRALNDKPVPEDLEGVRVAASLLDLAHDPGAQGLFRYAERQVLLALLGEAQPARPATLEIAAAGMHGEEKHLGALRARVLALSTPVEPLREVDPSVEPRSHGLTYRHEGASVWVQDDGGRWRTLGVRIRNAAHRPIQGGAFTFIVGVDRREMQFSCQHDALAVGETKSIRCSGNGTLPGAPLLRAIRGEVSAPMRTERKQVSFALPGGRVDITPESTRFIDDDAFVERRAMAMLDRSSCRDRGTCGVQAKEAVQARPTLLGFLLGLAGGGFYALVVLVRGRRAATIAASSMLVVLFAVLTAGVISAAIALSQAHILYVVLLTGAVAGGAGDVLLGFLAGLGVAIALVEFRRVPRGARVAK